MKLLAVVIAYNPDYNLLASNIESYSSIADCLIVWNNTDGVTNEECKMKLGAKFNALTNAQVHGEGKNMLIAYPLNRTIEWAIENGFTHILTLDQDSNFTPNSGEIYRQILTTNNYGIYGVNILANDSLKVKGNEVVFPNRVITSGTTYSLEIFKTIGLMREEYGIDGVDTEICYRARSRGYKIALFPNVILNHNFGETKKSKLGFKIRNYSPFRRYQIARNLTWLSKEYPDLFKDYLSLYKGFVYRDFYRILLCETNKFAKLGAIIKGVWHGHYYYNNKTKAKF